MRLLSFVLLFCLLHSAPAAQQRDGSEGAFVVSGSVLATDGSPVEEGSVGLFRQSVRLGTADLADTGGAFAFEPPEPGGYWLYFSLPERGTRIVPFLLRDGDSADFRVRLLGDGPADGAQPNQFDAALEFTAPGSPTARMATFFGDLWDAGSTGAFDREAYLHTIDDEADPLAREFLLALYYPAAAPILRAEIRGDSLVARRVLAEVPPESPAWSLQWGDLAPASALRGLVRVSDQPDVGRSYVEEVAARNADPAVRAAATFLLLEWATDAEQEGEATALFERLTGEYDDVPSIAAAASRFDPARPIQPGHRLPTFSAPQLGPDGDTTTGTVSSDALPGELTLIDGWATWCSPCIAEMPALHDAYERFREEGFEIVSLAFDDTPEEATAFRAGRWPMPWTHAFVEGGFASPTAEALTITALPFTVLVDEGGRILATGDALRGEELEATLERVLAPR